MPDSSELLGFDTPALTEAAVWERVGADPMSLLNDPAKAEGLTAIYREYAAVGERWSVPVLLFAPTWRANRDLAKPGDNRKALEFMRQFPGLRPPRRLFPGSALALMGPRFDCYSPEAALGREEAREFHSWQAEELADAGMVLIATLPAVSEGLGIVDVLAAPCVVSFVLTAQGNLLDGTPLRDAVSRIDDSARRPPAGYWLNCVHPQTALEGLRAAGVDPSRHRILGVQGNTSPLDPRAFSTASNFAASTAQDFAKGMLQIHREFAIPVVGGCCGTRTAHLDELASALHG